MVLYLPKLPNVLTIRTISIFLESKNSNTVSNIGLQTIGPRADSSVLSSLLTEVLIWMLNCGNGYHKLAVSCV